MQVCILLLAVFVFNYFLQATITALFLTEAAGFGLLIFYLNKKTSGFSFYFLLSCCATLFVNFYLDTIFYPLLTSYKADVQAPIYINQKLSGKPVYVMDSLKNAFQFYCKQPVQLLSKADLKNARTVKKIIYTDEVTLKNLQQKHNVEIIKVIDNYPNEIIYKQFIWHKTRSQALDKYYIIRY